MPTRIALTNATGRQSASLARAASAVGYHITAHIASASFSPLVAAELSALPHFTVHTGKLSSPELQATLFKDADLAFINTTSFDDELAVGKACADAAKRAGVRHVVYSSMPDHSAGNKDWKGLPQYLDKWKVEAYIRTLDVPATFVYAGIYHNNFTSLPYPLFCLREVPWEEVERWDGDWESDWVPERDGEETKGIKCGFEWRAPFPADVKLPWLDTEHDFGPAVLQVFKDGPKRWQGRRIPLAFSMLDPPSVCAAISRGLNRPVRYIEGPIEVTVPIPKGYRSQLEALEEVLGGSEVRGKRAPYWWDGLFETGKDGSKTEEEKLTNGEDWENIRPIEEEVGDEILRVPRRLWGAWRNMEEYAKDIFPVEEKLNRRTWMDTDSETE